MKRHTDIREMHPMSILHLETRDLRRMPFFILCWILRQITPKSSGREQQDYRSWLIFLKDVWYLNHDFSG